MSDGEIEPALRRVVVTVCENCINGVPGQCHMPGCLFIRWNIEDIPQPLKYLATYLEGTTEVSALRDLVSLKDGPRDDHYHAARDEAWARARAIISGNEVSQDTEEA